VGAIPPRTDATFFRRAAGYDTSTVAVFAALLRRARAAGPVEHLTTEEVRQLDAEADRRLGPNDAEDEQ
jgi:hypothetical protein